MPPQADGGAAGEAGASSGVAGAGTDAEQGGEGHVGQGDAGAGAGGSGAGTGGTPSGAGGTGDGASQGGGGASQGGGGASQGGGGASQGGALSGDAGAGMGALAGAGGSGDGPSFPVSVCGPGQWYVGEGLCAECPQTQQVFELACADYTSAQILTSTSGQLQFAVASLPSGVQGHEASPVDLSVTYLDPNESHARVLRFNTTGWTVDLRQAPDPPQTVIVPPFSTADVCGDVFHSLEPVRFERASGPAVSYTKVCP